MQFLSSEGNAILPLKDIFDANQNSEGERRSKTG
jgi:hypothetical protein